MNNDNPDWVEIVAGLVMAGGVGFLIVLCTLIFWWACDMAIQLNP